MKCFEIKEFLQPICETPDDIGSWFGYYNYDTLNFDQTKMLSCCTKNDAKVIKKGMTVEVGYYDVPSCVWHPIGVSDSYNYPQTCMLQWLPGEDNKNKVIYNLSENNHLIARIHDISTGEKRNVNWAIYGLTPDGKKSIALDLERSYWCRAYHYESVVNEDLNVNIPYDDGIFEIDLEKNTRKCIIPIQDIISMDSEPYFNNAKHWLEHIMISPSGKRFCFLHRFTIDSLNDYETRLFIADIDGDNLQIIKGWRRFYWSHFGWDGDDAFAIYAYELKKRKVENKANAVNGNKVAANGISLKKILKCLYHVLPIYLRKELKIRIKGQTAYYQYYVLNNGLFELSEDYKKREFDIDGHPSFTKDGEYMVTDSYPDHKQYQRLVVYNKKTHKAMIIGKIYAGLHQKAGSCDLHPKLCANDDILVVDTAYNGRHHMKTFKINWSLINAKLKN